MIEKKYFKDDHSVFYATQKESQKNRSVHDYFTGLYDKNKKIFEDYVCYYENIISSFNSKLKELQPDKKVYLFGAHIFSQFLLVNGLDESRISCILDNDILKQGKRLYGTNCIVKSPKEIKDDDAPIIIIKAASYTEEIKRDIIDNINETVVFWE